MSSNTSGTADFIIQSQYISQYLGLTLGFALFLCGIIGNFLNIIVFLSVGNYKQNPCSLYMFIGSILNLLDVIIGIGPRILILGFQIDLQQMNRIWCKFRISLLNFLGLSLSTIICLQSVDTFLCTSRSVNLRQRSNIKRARLLLLIIGLFWSMHEITTFILQDIVIVNGIPSCVMTSSIYASYRSYFIVPVTTITIPISIISIFGFYSYRHFINQLGNDSHSFSAVTKQFTKMALCQIVNVLLFQGPFGCASIYFLATTNVVKDSYRQAQERLVTAFFSVYVYGLYATPFYCYCIASKRFRNQLCQVFHRFTCQRASNRVQPETQ
ncbi:unnamed protein product [Adineta ricciae]|uniref:G-protein coupled receptors family 1 profile domain-containing protein n=1 Tax=Adineta ricciae TaxID=249248 RepID=A0A816F4P1_ADIRI|nr:unnamed protein product [Adineta ricciae]CAF1657803.1 unnamed protein product [Adineta ricciae]